jgi:hypothetical protein
VKMTEFKDDSASAALPSNASEAKDEVAGTPLPVAPQPIAPLPVYQMSQGQDQISKLISHPAVKGYLGKSIKIIALFACLGCLLLWCAITAISNIICGALPH